MNLLKLFVVTSMMFSGVQAFAHHDDKNGPCKTFWESCKGTKGKKAKMECVKAAAAADTMNGPACTTSMEEHHKGHHHMDKAAGKDMPAPTGTVAPGTN